MEVEFLNSSSFTMLYFVNRFVDFFFVMDMVLTFFVKVQVEEHGKTRSRRALALTVTF